METSNLINSLTAVTILDEQIFLNLLEVEDEVVQQREILALQNRAAELGKKTEFLKLLKAYQKQKKTMEREQTWIRAIQRRNSREAAEQLIQTYYDEIYRFVYRQTGSKEDAMDLTQSVFIAVLRALPGYRAERASFRTWLYRIAANKVIDTRRKARPVSIPIQEMELPAAEDFVARVHDRALLETIEGYVSGLDPGEQAVFRLRIYGEKTFPEIAAAMGEPEAAVKSRYYRLIGRLRKEFGADG